MKKQKDLLIIIPAYNEEGNIRGVFEALKKNGIVAIADILVINDASSDATGQVIRAQGYRQLINRKRQGYGASLQLGYRYAVRNGYEYVIQLDADGQHDPCNIPAIYRKLRERDGKGELPDIVLACRFMEGSSDFRVSIFKKTAYALFRQIIRAVTGRRITDPTTGLQGLGKRAFAFYAKDGNFDRKYPDANMIIQMLLLGYRIVEIPAVMHARTDGRSMHYGFRAAWYMLRMFASIAWVVLRLKLWGKGRKRRGKA